MTDTLIIAGGLAGSAVALWLADQGRTSVLVEARFRLPDYAPDHLAPCGQIAFAGADLYSADQAWFEGALLTTQAAVAALAHILTQKDPNP